MKIRGIYLLYRVLQALGWPLILLYFLYRGVADRGYWRTLPQRFGFLPRSFSQTGPGAIWLHAVSVGEVLASVEFLKHLRRDLPHARVFVSVSTLAGHSTAQQKLAGLAEAVFYAPLDFVFVVRRILRALKPSVVVIAETEIWPNLFREAKRTAAALLLVNGRVSDRAFPRYSRYAWFFGAVLSHVDVIHAQSVQMRQRFLLLGAPAKQVRVAGNFKYDFEPRQAPADSPVARLIERIQPRKVWIAASTMPPGEDDAALAAFRQLAEREPGLLLILAPRKPAMFDEVVAKLEGTPHLRRSHLSDGDTLALPGILLLDSIGELSGLFPFADAVFMGGTLADTGGHNILEPALFGKPVITGPHMENFRAIAEEFRAARAVVEISTEDELMSAVQGLLDSPADARAIGERARACAESQRGASAAAASEVRHCYDSGLPRYRASLPALILGKPLQQAWLLGGRTRKQRDFCNLGANVISVGNLSMGGTGKTPCVLRIAQLLKSRGANPGILTRGYGRVSHEPWLALKPGEAIPVHHTGDEAQILVRSGLAPVGIGADRYAAGLELIRRFGCDTLILDDGFQHRRLARNVDIVLIDALDPLAGGGVFPLGRLREPFSAIERADVILITRSEFSDLIPAIEREIRGWNSRAPLFRARLRARDWVNADGGESSPPDQPPFRHPGAFCGIGNPQSFRRSLEQLEIQPVAWEEFKDHHRYRAYEAARLRKSFEHLGADAMVTTEKDAVNLPEAANGLPVYFLRVEMEIEAEEKFLASLLDPPHSGISRPLPDI